MQRLFTNFLFATIFISTAHANDGGITIPSDAGVSDPTSPATDAGTPFEWLTGESCEFGVYEHTCEGDVLHSCLEEPEEDMVGEEREAFEVIANCAAFGATCGESSECRMASGDLCPFWDSTRCVVPKDGGDCLFFDDDSENLTQILCEKGGSCVMSFDFENEIAEDICQPAIGTCFVGGEPRFCTDDNYLAFCMQMEDIFALVDPLGFNCNSMGVACGTNEYGEAGCIWGVGDPCHVNEDDDSHILACAEGLVCNGFIPNVVPGVCEPIENEIVDAGTESSESDAEVADAGSTTDEEDEPITPATQGCSCHSHTTSSSSLWGMFLIVALGFSRRFLR